MRPTLAHRITLTAQESSGLKVAGAECHVVPQTNSDTGHLSVVLVMPVVTGQRSARRSGQQNPWVNIRGRLPLPLMP
jgi:hypothetical protein